MKKLIVFDLDGTLAESKTSLDAEMSRLLGDLLGIVKAAVISEMCIRDSHKMNAYWRAANYLSVGQIYLYDNPLLKEPLKLSHVKPLVVGHWGTVPGLSLIHI